MRTKHDWVTIKELESEAQFDDYRDEGMCCGSIFYTKEHVTCSVCSGDHVVIERLVRCKSGTCLENAVCLVQWKVFHCTADDKWVVKLSQAPHSRGALPCFVVLRPKLTKAMKEFVFEQDGLGKPPRLILALMKKKPTIPKPRRGWPTPAQLHSYLKRARREIGAKNSIKSIREFVRVKARDVDTTPATDAFVFGASLDLDGFAYVGSGEDDDAFVLGITSARLLRNAVGYADGERFALFHADATFKLSDIGYPVVVCGITDQARAFQLVALLVVSRRTSADYTACFQSLQRVVIDVCGRPLRITAAMGDAEDAQYLAVQATPHLAPATTSNWETPQRRTVTQSIMDMHFCATEREFFNCRDRELAKWKSDPQLKKFMAYFELQWLEGRFWRWQIYHTPGGFAATNIPCEVYNAGIKRFTQRKRFPMKLLLSKLCDLVEIADTKDPVASDYVPTPTADVNAAADAMIRGERIVVESIKNSKSVRVRHVRFSRLGQAVNNQLEGEDEDVAFRAAFDLGESEMVQELPVDTADIQQIRAPRNESPNPILPQPETEFDDREFHESTEAEPDEKEKAKAAELYMRAVKWSLLRTHVQGMPDIGWVVSIEQSSCECSYYAKFKICSHIVIARRKRNLQALGCEGTKFLKNRILGKRRRQTSKGKGQGSAQAQGRRTDPTPSVGNAQIQPELPANTGRPPRSMSALEVQFILCD